MSVKPLGRKAYGSICHLPTSRLGESDHHVHAGQARICLEITRDFHDIVYVEEKLDGSCCAVANVGGEILPLTRSGYLASTSCYEQHWLFAAWVAENRKGFSNILPDGWSIVGEWIAQAHGTLYDSVTQPFIPFDIITDKRERLNRCAFKSRLTGWLTPAPLLHWGGAAPINYALGALLERAVTRTYHTDYPEGLVYRVERNGKVDFLAKWVDPNKIDGLYLPEVSGCPAVWNWGPKS